MSSKPGFSWKLVANALKIAIPNPDDVLKTYDDEQKWILTPLLDDGIWCNGYRNIGIVIQKVDEMIGNDDAKTLEDFMEKKFKKYCDIRFNYTEERFVENSKNPNDVIERKEFLFSFNIAFSSKKDDVLILELAAPDYDRDRPYPKRFTLDHEFNANYKESYKFHVFGHPNGKVLQTDLNCEMLSKEMEEEIQQEKVNFWTSFKKDLKIEDINAAYSDCKITESRVLFHVSKSTSHGASGAPCLQEKNGQPVVQVMLLGGYPKFFYNKLSDEEQESKELKEKFLIEAGIPMSKVQSLLQQHRLYELCDNLFRE